MSVIFVNNEFLMSCVQYFSPYVSADLNRMANAFNTSVASLEDELTQLILDKQISARIDSQKKVALYLLYFAVSDFYHSF